MMLLRLDPDQEAIGVLSVPRDLVVDIPGHGRAKINEAYTDGGLDLTARTIKELLHIQINHVIVDEKGVIYADDRVTGGLYILKYTGAGANRLEQRGCHSDRDE